MEILFILFLIVIFLKVTEGMFNRFDLRDKTLESKKPPNYCSVCSKPNKKPGDTTIVKFRPGKDNKLVCDDCFGKYKFCANCEKPTEEYHYIFGKGPCCKTCFESTPRSFLDTKIAVKYEQGKSCSICGSKRNIEVHHKTYERAGVEKLEELVVLCRSCHNTQHAKVYSGPRGGKYVIKKGKKIYISDDDVKYKPKP